MPGRIDSLGAGSFMKWRLDSKVGESRYKLAVYLEEPDNIKSIKNNSSKDLESFAGAIVNHSNVIYIPFAKAGRFRKSFDFFLF